MKRIISIIAVLLASVFSAYAVTAYKGPVAVTQPDGTTLTIYLHGDEFLHWTTCGNSLVAKESDGFWHYAAFNEDGTTKAHGSRVVANMSGKGDGITPPAPAIAKALEKRESLMSQPPVKNASHPISTGEKRFLILLIQFSDKSFTKTKDDFVNMLSGDSYSYNGATGSVTKYYNDVSFGKFTPIFDVYGPITVSYTSASCAKDDKNAVIEACNIADANLGVDFTKYCNANSSLVDNVFYFFPGYNQAEGGGSDTVWPHAVTYTNPFLTLDGVGIYRYGCTSEYKGSSDAKMAGIGTFCHEFGHILGLPDFYDVDYGTNGQGFALDCLSLMSSGNYNNEGRTPPYLTYEEKNILGWDDGLTSLTEGVNTLAKTSENKTYYSPTPTSGEYYLYESRPCEGWDTYTGVPGMAIYHIDKSDYVMPDGKTAAQHWTSGNMINAYASHQCMDLIETVSESNLKYYEEIVFPGYNNVTSFTSSSQPSATSWAGVPTGYNLTDISFDPTTGSTSFTVISDKKIVGSVKNTKGQGLSGVEVILKYVASTSEMARRVSSCGNGLSMINLEPKANSLEIRLVTNWEGKFSTDLDQDGVYSVAVSEEGYVPYRNNVSVNGAAEINIVLQTPADKAGVTLQKYTAISNNIVGFGAKINHYAGLKYTASELSEYVGSSINSISFMVFDGNGGTFDKIGVQVFFDDDLQCDCECTCPVFATMCTVDISKYNLRIPSGKDVTFVYYLLNPSFGYPLIIADQSNPTTGGNLISTGSTSKMGTYSGGNFVISATISNHSKVVDLAGINYIPHSSSYTAGQTFNLQLKQSSTNPPASVSWTVNGNPASESVVLETGIYTIQALLTFASGRQETIETKFNVE